MKNIQKNIFISLIIVAGVFLFSQSVLATPSVVTTLPSGDLNAVPLEGGTSVTIGVSTNNNSTCKYHLTNGSFDYATEGTLFTVTGGTSHTSSLDLSPWGSYWVLINAYVKCDDGAGINDPAHTIAFTSEIDPVVATPAGGTYTAAQSVSLASDPLANIYYTTDGSDPTISSTLYSAPISISSTTTLKAKALSGNNSSGLMTEVYTVNITDPPLAIITTPTITNITTTGATFNWTTNIAANTRLIDYINSTNVAIVETTTSHSFSYPLPNTPSQLPLDCGTSYGVGSFEVSSTSMLGNDTVTVGVPAFATLDCPAPTTFTVTPSAGANGTISPSTAQTINSGSTTSFTVTPSSGYTATVDGTCGGTLVGTTYTTNAITTDCTVSATFAPTVTTFTVTPSAGANGTISPNTAQTINSGSTTSFTVTPSSGYTATVGGTCGGSLVGTTYTTNAITADCTVSATFAVSQSQVVAPVSSPGGGSFSSAQSVTLSSGTSGATIYYTTNGTTPTTSSTLYSGAVTISSTTTLKAIAVKSGMTDSTVMTEVFTISTGTAVSNVSAGVDKTVNAPTTLIGSATGTGLTYEWSKVSGPGAVTFGSSTSATTTVSVVVDGTYVLRLTATDGSGGTAYDDMTLIWDSAPPTATFDSFGTTDTTPQLAGTSTGAPVSIVLYIGSATYNATLNSNGTWTAGVTTALTPNAYNVRVRAFDLAGNYNDTYVILTISSGTATTSTSTTTSTSSSSSSAENNSKKIKNTSKYVKGGDTIVQTGKRFPKHAKVLLFYQNSNGSYNAPQMIKTDGDGKFSIKYVVKKTPGVYNWFAQDYNSGTRSWSKYRVK